MLEKRITHRIQGRGACKALSVLLAAILALAGAAWGSKTSARAASDFQSASTAPASAGGITVTVNTGDNPEIKVRAGPSTEFDQVGTLQAGDTVPGLGRSAGGDWVQITYAQGPGGVGWVYSYLVTVSGMLPVVEPPFTPTPRVTPTIDKTLAAQFIVEIPPTRKPTFTTAPSLAIPTFVSGAPPTVPGGEPALYLMVGLAVIGIIGALLSFIRVR